MKSRASLIPINVAETIIDPCWDPNRSGLSQWQIASGKGHGLKVSQYWCYIVFEWARKPVRGPALQMTRRFDLDCRGYRDLVVCILTPPRTMVRLSARTDRGALKKQFKPAGEFKVEYALNLGGAARLKTVTIEILAAEEGIKSGWIYWVGMSKGPALLKSHLDLWRHYDKRWAGYLEPESHKPSFMAKVGLLANAREWRRLSRLHARHLARGGVSPFMKAAREALKQSPESLIGPNIKCFNERFFCREREHEANIMGKDILGFAGNAAVAGIFQRDARLLRLGARYALAIASCEHWDDFMCYVPGSTFDQRCFTATGCAFQCALVLDLAWDLFTPLGRELIQQKIAKLGLADITFNTWKYEYIFRCNQLAFFTYGRMAGALMLESVWPRARNETEQAYRDIIESTPQNILPDGGFGEGPSYFTMMGGRAGLAFYMYALARKKPLSKVVPKLYLKTGDFAAAIASTDDTQDVIPFCDSIAVLDLDTFAFMAALLPRSQWVNIYRKAVRRDGGLPGIPMALSLDARIPQAGRAAPAFVFLPVMGVMASTRRVAGKTVKLFLMGNRSGMGHCHEDKGSFVLEFAGDTFACDPGTADYSTAAAGTRKHCQVHNMLAPTGLDERPHPANPVYADVRPRGKGDQKMFEAEIDCTPGWEPTYRYWRRRWRSPQADQLVIRDEYALKRGDGVEFLWQTRLPVNVKGQTITLRGRQATVILSAPAGTTIAVETEKISKGGPLVGSTGRGRHHTIRIRKAGRSGVMEVHVRLKVGGQ